MSEEKMTQGDENGEDYKFKNEDEKKPEAEKSFTAFGEKLKSLGYEEAGQEIMDLDDTEEEKAEKEIEIEKQNQINEVLLHISRFIKKKNAPMTIIFTPGTQSERTIIEPENLGALKEIIGAKLSRKVDEKRSYGETSIEFYRTEIPNITLEVKLIDGNINRIELLKEKE